MNSPGTPKKKTITSPHPVDLLSDLTFTETKSMGDVKNETNMN
jgi:hypothetical protein